MKKRVLVLCMLVSVFLSASFISANAETIIANGTCGDNLTWTLTDNNTLTISGTGDMYNYDYDGAPWFYLLESNPDIYIQSGVTSIGENALSGFYGSNIYIPDTITELDFHFVWWAKNIHIDDNNPAYASIDGVVFSKDKSTLLYFPSTHELTTYTIPDTTTTIASSAFVMVTLDHLIIPNSITTIKSYAIDSSFINKITFGNGLTLIEGEAVCVTPVETICITDIAAWCNITFKCNTGRRVGGVFCDCPSAKLYINGVEINELVIPDTVTTINNYAFYGLETITSVTIPDTVSFIGEDAFGYCSSINNTFYLGTQEQWGKIDIGDGNSYLTNNLSIEWIDKGTCENDVTYELSNSGVLRITGTGAIKNFSSSSTEGWRKYKDFITSVIIDNGVTNIGAYAFSNCANLTKIELPKSITTIEANAFNGCSKLTDVYIKSIEDWYNITFKNVYSNPLCNRANLFLNNKKLTKLIINENVTEIKPFTFYSCLSLNEVIFNSGITTIGDSAFRRCENIKSIELPDSLKTIDSDAFRYCYALENVIISEGISSLASGIFYNCNSGW